MSRKKLNEFQIGSLMSGMIGGYIIAALKGQADKTAKIKRTISKYDAEIEAKLTAIDKSIAKNAKEAQKLVNKMSKKDQDEINKLMSYMT